MRLVHYSCAPVDLVTLRELPQTADTFKPKGFWVSDDDCEENWRRWCLAESFSLGCLTHVHDVVLVPDANVLRLSSAGEIDALTNEYRCSDRRRDHALGWERMRERYAGLIITPYIWERRLEGDAGWYYGWDCASGCIWDPAAIASVTLRDIVSADQIEADRRADLEVA